MTDHGQRPQPPLPHVEYRQAAGIDPADSQRRLTRVYQLILAAALRPADTLPADAHAPCPADVPGEDAPNSL